jgi:hypothetical protein
VSDRAHPEAVTSDRDLVIAREVRTLPSPVRAEVWLDAHVGVAERIVGEAAGVGTGSRVLLAGAPVGESSWFAGSVLPFEGDDLEASRIVLVAHALYLLRRAGARGGDGVRMTSAGRGAGLGALARAFGLNPDETARARWAFWTEPMPLKDGCTVLYLAGEPPRGMRTATGPIGPIDPRTYLPVGEVRWPLSRCLGTASELMTNARREDGP